ncbi:amphi-Trp domain-containing protein [Mesorhizobium sp. NPDC059054]|uniref:amphi-Trp domain-containing protein n=1 Tax=Mesorhizobium sp. NPDC059054 TaxID=3346711 RepID=UPI0036AB36C2
MSHPAVRDIDKIYPRQEFVAKLRRLADALEAGKRFEISIDGEKIRVPAGAVASIEHERGEGEEEIEFQLRWNREIAGDESASGD